MGRILAIDYGTRRTGIAVSDPLRLIAGGLETVETKGLEAWLAKYFAREDVSTIVVGKPSRMDGTPSETWRFIEPLAGRLRRAWPDKEVVFYDERFTSVMAHRTMLESPHYHRWNRKSFSYTTSNDGRIERLGRDMDGQATQPGGGFR